MADDWNERIWTQLKRIADSLELMRPDPEPVAEPEPEIPPCSHPMEARTDFGMTNGHPDWMCRLCGFNPQSLPSDPETTIQDRQPSS